MCAAADQILVTYNLIISQFPKKCNMNYDNTALILLKFVVKYDILSVLT